MVCELCLNKAIKKEKVTEVQGGYQCVPLEQNHSELEGGCTETVKEIGS